MPLPGHLPILLNIADIRKYRLVSIQGERSRLAVEHKDALWQAMQSVLDTVTPTDAATGYRHCGYSLREN